MIELIGIILGIATAAFIAYPLFFRKPEPVASVDDEQLQELYSRRNTAYSMLKELEFDYNTGILTQEDYKDLESRYKNNAVSILKGIDEQARTSDDIESEIEEQVRNLRTSRQAASMDEEIEKEVGKLRRVKPVAGVDAQIEKRVPRLHQRRNRSCPRCGTRNQPGDNFCRHCGTKFRGE